MSRLLKNIPGLMLACLLALASIQSYAATVEYSAEAVMTSPKHEQVVKTWVGKQHIRTEMSVGDETIIQIVNQATGKAWTIYPGQKTYTELTSPAPADAGGESASRLNPCAKAPPGATCRSLGKEDVNGRPASKWEMVMQQQGQSMRSVQWIDEQHGFPVKMEHPQGKTELLMLGQETVNGRATEKWQMTNTGRGGKSQTATQWYDPQLGTAVREQMPGGFTRELRNIIVAPQPANLFTLPSGYRKVQGQGQDPGQGKGRQGGTYR